LSVPLPLSSSGGMRNRTSRTLTFATAASAKGFGRKTPAFYCRLRRLRLNVEAIATVTNCLHLKVRPGVHFPSGKLPPVPAARCRNRSGSPRRTASARYSTPSRPEVSGIDVNPRPMSGPSSASRRELERVGVRARAVRHFARTSLALLDPHDPRPPADEVEIGIPNSC